MCFALLTIIPTHANAVDVIANNSNSLYDTKNLTQRELRAIFSLKLKQWPDGLPITVVALSNNSSLHKDFCKKVLNVFPHQLQLGWDRITFSGLGRPPIVVDTTKEMHDIIRKTPGAIGYSDSIDADKDGAINIIKLDGI